MSDKPVNFQIVIDDASYKQYSIGNLQGPYLIKIKNIEYFDTNNTYVGLVRLKSNILFFDAGSPTKDIIFNHSPSRPDLPNSIYLNAQLQTWIDFQVIDYETGNAPANFKYCVLHMEATPN
jgi:hypothetical protein